MGRLFDSYYNEKLSDDTEDFGAYLSEEDQDDINYSLRGRLEDSDEY